VTSRDATEVPPGHGAGAEAEDEYAPVLPGEGASDYDRYLRTDELLSLINRRLYPELWDVRNELTELAKQDD
jgi:hypothetical protein